MRTCSVCGGDCDAGELIGGFCYGCRRDKKESSVKKQMDRLLNSPSKQMSLVFDSTDPAAYRGRQLL